MKSLFVAMPAIVLLAGTLAEAQPPVSELTKTITALDSALCDSYDKCQLEKFSPESDAGALPLWQKDGAK